jgi:hypothetical protein
VRRKKSSINPSWCDALSFCRDHERCEVTLLPIALTSTAARRSAYFFTTTAAAMKLVLSPAFQNVVVIITIAGIFFLFQQKEIRRYYRYTNANLPSRTRIFDEYALHLNMHRRRVNLVNESTAVRFGLIYSHFKAEAEDALGQGWLSNANESAREEYLKLFTDVQRTDVMSGDMCGSARAFREAERVKKHVFIGGEWGDNWGAFSTPISNRTVDWGEWLGHWKMAGCEMDDVWYYLNHTNLSAIVTTQHQWLDHPKIISVPLGQQSNAAYALQTRPMLNRTNLLLISSSESETRTPIYKHVIANFNGTIKNRKGDGSDYYENLMSSKFILAPSGLGLDCYRNWEALILGAIPVLETLNRRDGLFRAYQHLPVLWIDHFENVTPSLLENEYPRIISKARGFKFEKLTLQYWIDLVNSYREIQHTGDILIAKNPILKI